jgi:hypothetical protein
VYLKIERNCVNRPLTLILALPLFAQFFQKQLQALRFFMSNHMLFAEVEKVPQPLYVLLNQAGRDVAPLQPLNILSIYSFGYKFHACAFGWDRVASPPHNSRVFFSNFN